MTLFIPEGFTFMRTLNSGFYGPTYIVKRDSSGDHYICKYFMKNAIGNQKDLEEFIRVVKLSRKVREKFFQPFRVFHEEEQYFVGIRPFFAGLNLTTFIASIDSSTNLLYAIWKVLVRLYKHLGKHKITPIFIKPSNIFIENGSIAFITDIYPPPSRFNPTLHSPTPLDVGFLAPEFIAGKLEVPEKADTWALGVLLWFMISRKLPWNTSNAVVMLRQIQNCQPEGLEFLPDMIQDVVLQMLVLNPNERVSLEVLAHTRPASKQMSPKEGTKLQKNVQTSSMKETKSPRNMNSEVAGCAKVMKCEATRSCLNPSELCKDKPLLNAARREILPPTFLKIAIPQDKGGRRRSFAKILVHKRGINGIEIPMNDLGSDGETSAATSRNSPSMKKKVLLPITTTTFAKETLCD